MRISWGKRITPCQHAHTRLYTHTHTHTNREHQPLLWTTQFTVAALLISFMPCFQWAKCVDYRYVSLKLAVVATGLILHFNTGRSVKETWYTITLSELCPGVTAQLKTGRQGLKMNVQPQEYRTICPVNSNQPLTSFWLNKVFHHLHLWSPCNGGLRRLFYISYTRTHTHKRRHTYIKTIDEYKMKYRGPNSTIWLQIHTQKCFRWTETWYFPMCSLSHDRSHSTRSISINTFSPSCRN